MPAMNDRRRFAALRGLTVACAAVLLAGAALPGAAAGRTSGPLEEMAPGVTLGPAPVRPAPVRPDPVKPIPGAPAPGRGAEGPAGADRLEGALARAFRQAHAESGVPVELLIAVGFASTRLDNHGGEPSVENGYGVMHLVDNPANRSLHEAAALLGAAPEALKHSDLQNIRGGAALLAAYARDSNGDLPAGLAGWYPAVARYVHASPAVARLFADEVFAVLNRGVDVAAGPGGGFIHLAPRAVALPPAVDDPPVSVASIDYATAHWIPAHPENYDRDHNRPADGLTIDYIVIHTTEGSYASAINWFQNPAAGVSAHYIIRSSDGDITQMVREKDVAWHAGNSYYNHHSIGIEHEAFVSNCTWYTDVMYRTSAALVRRLTEKYGIPRDRKHIVAHSEVPGADHTDPGRCWDWTYYMSLVNGTWYTVVDNTTPGRFWAGEGWGTSSWNSQRWGANYRFAQPRAAQDSAYYKANIPTAGYYDIYIWYPSNPGYNANARIVIWQADSDGDGEVATARYVDQRSNGGRWVHLGAFPLLRRDDWILAVSRWSDAPGYIIADAIKIVLR